MDNGVNRPTGSEIVEIIIDSVYDAFEEFFDALVAPSVQFTLYAFVVSLFFLGYSIAAKIMSIRSFVTLDEAVTCSVILLFIVLIDTGARDKIKQNVNKVKSLTEKIYNSDNKIEEGVQDDEQRE